MLFGELHSLVPVGGLRFWRTGHILNAASSSGAPLKSGEF